jgi:NSS family neurotransmitter:Na+ symporter
MAADRGMWGSRLGFILAAAGSAIGLGNIWAFPTQVGRGGGAAFVLVYLLCVAAICAPILIAEIVLGRGSRLSPVGAFAHFSRPGSRWWLAGALDVVSCVGVLTFYTVIGGWTLAYVWFSLSGTLVGDASAIGDLFARFSADGVASVLCTLLFIGLTVASNIGGVRAGIERITTILMPLLLVLLLVLAGRALMLPGAAEGLVYYLRPDFSAAFNMTMIGAALGQAFFSLSLGNGSMLTYGSYLSRSEGIANSVLWVVILDTSIALLAGLIIFPAGFSLTDFDPSTSGPGLIFNVLPQLFATLPGGSLFGTAFFVLLVMAALTSAIALLEVPIANLVDRGWSRPAAVLTLGATVFVLAVPSALGNGAVGLLTDMVPAVWGGNYLGFMATIWNNFSLPIGGLLVAIFVGHVWGVDQAVAELVAEGRWFPMPALWGLLLRVVAPIAIVVIIVTSVMAMF